MTQDEHSNQPPAAHEAGKREPAYSLLAPPNYDNIVGGVAPSPFAALLLLAGAVIILVAAAGDVMGVDMLQWWELGAVLVALAIFLAAFVSRSA